MEEEHNDIYVQIGRQRKPQQLYGYKAIEYCTQAHYKSHDQQNQ